MTHKNRLDPYCIFASRQIASIRLEPSRARVSEDSCKANSHSYASDLTESVLPTPTTSAANNSTSSPRSTHHHSTSHQSRTSSSTAGVILTSSTITSGLATTSPVDLRHANTIGGIVTGAAAAVLLLVCAVFWFVKSRFTRRMSPYGDFTDTEKNPQSIMKASDESISNIQVHHNATAASRANPLHPL